ncbi:cob(I)yrinic acid a,c-diamide adenosyltransferase [Balneatrix alpica]|uniref:Corrinoid adenosyltransferase n=1 Tax=Balneatrix alpica TaxID=75684 RepID=A0ABV5Z8D7_9GAMM|nr:cob(I)yrinic acid a,c-diamide adenosyltransferase [Balneatrix alpica]
MENSGSDKNERHQKRMARMKAHVDQQVAKAQEQRGILVLLTGNGKGKSSSAFGMVGRALGHGQKVGVLQFIKSEDWQCGERQFFAQHPDVEFHIMGTGFTWETQNRELDIAAAERLWQQGERMLQDPHYDLVVMDELTYMFKFGYLPFERVATALRQRPSQQNVVITGRAAQPGLIELADTVSEIADIKHAFRAGIQAQAGIEF